MDTQKSFTHMDWRETDRQGEGERQRERERRNKGKSGPRDRFVHLAKGNSCKLQYTKIMVFSFIYLFFLE